MAAIACARTIFPQLGDQLGDQDDHHEDRADNVFPAEHRDRGGDGHEDLGADLAFPEELEETVARRHRQNNGSGIPTVPVLTYIQSVRRSLVSRIAALAIATLVGSSASGLGVAHGYAHHEAGEHAGQDRGHDRASAAEATKDLHHEALPSIDAVDESRHHSHPQVAPALSVRLGHPLFVLSMLAGSVSDGIVFVDIASLPLNSAAAGPRPPDASPRQPRAPPLG